MPVDKSDVFHTLMKCMAKMHLGGLRNQECEGKSRVKFRKIIQNNLRMLLDIAIEPEPELDLIDSHPSSLDTFRDTPL